VASFKLTFRQPFQALRFRFDRMHRFICHHQTRKSSWIE
jgi:hypothetical protein